MIKIPEKLKCIMDNNQELSAKVLSTISPFVDILNDNKLCFFSEYTDHGINHIENILQYAENLIADETFSYLTSEEVGVIILSVVLHDIGMHTNPEMFKNMIDGEYDDVSGLFPNEKTWKQLWNAYLYDSQYWDDEKKWNVFGEPNHIINKPNLSDFQDLTEYDKKLIGEFIRLHHCRIAHEVSLKGFIGKSTIPFVCDGIEPLYIKIAGIVARSHGMDVRDTFDYLEEMSGDRFSPLGIHAVYLMVLLRLADYLQIDSSRTSETLLKIKNLNSPYSIQEHKTHLSISGVHFSNTDKEKILIQAYPNNAQTYVKIERLSEDIQRELDRSWAILGEVYSDYNYKLRYRRITTNISNEKYKNNLDYVPEQFGFRFNNELFKLLIAPLYGSNPSYGVRELVQNAVDACRLCMNDSSNDKEPCVIVKVDTEKKQFTISDTGKGMNLDEIKNYFLTIGSSYNDNINWRKVRDNEQIYRTGRFGIGVLAAFLLGSEINVVTKKRGESVGFRFKASLNDKFIQINKAKNVDYGTTIEINCDDTIIKKLENDASWCNWYIGETPQVDYYINGNSTKKGCNSTGYRELKHTSKRIGRVYWKPTEYIRFASNEYNVTNKNVWNPSLFCNGFLITRQSRKRYFSLCGLDEYRYIQIPDLQVTDIYNQLPINLQRNNIERNVTYEFEEELVKMVFVDLMCQLMATNIKLLFEIPRISLFNYHSNGFSLQSNYISTHIEEKEILIINREILRRIGNHYRIIELFNYLQGNSLIIRFGTPAEYSAITSPSRVEQRKTLLNNINKNFNRVLDNFKGFYNDKPFQFVELTRKKILTRNKTIDTLFKKYMNNDPVVPYEMSKREQKFPLLFQEYSDIINQYKN